MKLPRTLVPVLAGYYPDGRPAYLASAFSHTSSQPDCCVCEGMKPEELRVCDIVTKRIMIPDAVGVAELRYEREAYTEEYLNALILAGKK